MSLTRQILLNGSLAAAAVIVTLAGVEIAFRFLAVAPPPLRSATASFVEYDSLLGWRKIPHLTGEAVTERTAVSLRFNSRGLRSPEYSHDKPVGTLRILALGDSFAEGYTVEFEHLFSRVLERQLKEDGVQSQVVNAGTRGYSTDQELLFYLSEGRRYGSDLTVLLFHDNDVWYNARSEYPRGPKPLYQLEGEDLVLTNVPPPRLPDEEGPVADSTTPSSGSIKRWLAERFHLYRFARDGVKESRLLHRMAIAAGVASEPVEAERILPDVWTVFLEDPGPAVEHAWRVTEALLEKLRDDVEADGGRLLLFYVPGALVVDEEVWRGVARRYQLGNEADRDAVRQTLSTIAERHEIELLDPTEEFRRSAMRVYVPGEGHWNEAGHRLVANLIRRWIHSAPSMAASAEGRATVPSSSP